MAVTTGATVYLAAADTDGLPVHDLMAYLAAGLALVALGLAVWGLLLMAGKLRQARGQYRCAMDHLTFLEAERRSHLDGHADDNHYAPTKDGGKHR